MIDLKARKKKHKLLEDLFEKYNKLMYHVAYQILNDKYLAEDAVQTAFLNLGKNNFKIDTVLCNKTRAFMIIITRNYAFQIYNKRKKEVILKEEEISEISDESNLPLNIIINNERRDEISRELAKIDIKYSDVLIFKYFYDYSFSEIASLMNISEQLVRVRLYRAKKLLLQQLTEGRKCNE